MKPSLLLVAFLSAFVGGVVGVLSGSATETEPAAPPPAEVPDDRLEELERKIAALEAATISRSLEAANRTAPVPASDRGEAAPEATAEVDADPVAERRIATLERTVADLVTRVGGLGAMPDDLAGVLLALEDKNLVGHQVDAAEKERRMALHRWLVDNAPDHPEAAGALKKLVSDLLFSGGPKQALETLDEHAARVGLSGWPLDRQRASLLSQSGRPDDARRIYIERESDPRLSDSERASAMFWRAYSYREEGRYDEARATFNQLIARFGQSDDRGVDDSVGGARTQLEQIADR